MISKQKNFLFIHVPKTGGNSIQNILAPYADDKIVTKHDFQDGLERFEIENSKLKIEKHSTLTSYKEQLDKNVYDGLYKFSVIRNPFERLISFYFSPHRGEQQWDKQNFIKFMQTVEPLSYYINTEKQIRIANIFRKSKRKENIDNELDFLISFENLENDFETVCETLDIPIKILPHRNKSNRENFHKYYDSELEALVMKKYGDEIKYGNYSL